MKSGFPESAFLKDLNQTVESINHDRIKQLSSEHPRDISTRLARLVQDGYLHKEGETRARVYFLPQDFAGTEGELPFTEEDSSLMPVETPVENAIKTPNLILKLMRESPAITLEQISKTIGKDPRTIERAVNKLEAENKVKHQGPKKGGTWEILEKP